MKLSEITEKIQSTLGNPFTEHKWESSNSNFFIKMSFLPNTATASEHYEITYDNENNLFYISLHFENKQGHKDFERFIDQNIDAEFKKTEQNWQKKGYKGKGLTFYMLEGQEEIKNDENVIENLSNLIKRTALLPNIVIYVYENLLFTVFFCIYGYGSYYNRKYNRQI